MAEIVIHPPIQMRLVGNGPGVAEVPPTMCDAGHPMRPPMLAGWEPCRCGGHRSYRCSCGTTSRYRAKDVPVSPCPWDSSESARASARS